MAKPKIKVFDGMKDDIKHIQIPSRKSLLKTTLLVILFSAIASLYLFGCDAFISYFFGLLNI